MACNHSSAATNTCNDGHTPLALGVAQGKIPNFNINGIFPFNGLPVEIQNKIIGYAMMATDHKIKFPCLTNAGFTPNVTVGLLLVNHRIYHEAYYQLRKQNTFVFGNFGSDLKALGSSVGPLKCRSGMCGHRPLQSMLANVEFYLGDEEMPGYAHDKVHAFGCVLKYLRSDIIVGSLQIKLAYHTFTNSAELSWFASTLTRIKVQDKLSVTGDEEYLEMSLGDFPTKFGMSMMPVYSGFRAYQPDIQYSPGYFHFEYKREKSADGGSSQQQRSIVDTKTILQRREAFGVLDS